MSAVQFIFRGEACWRGGEEFREGFNLSAWIWGRAAARFEPSFPVHVHDAPFCLLKELFPLQPYKYFLKEGNAPTPTLLLRVTSWDKKSFFQYLVFFQVIQHQPDSQFCILLGAPQTFILTASLAVSILTCYLLNVCCSLSPKFMALFL